MSSDWSIDGRDASIVAVDVGGTNLKGMVLDSARVVFEETRPMVAEAGESPPSAVVDFVVDLARRASADHRVAGVGMAVPGLVNDADGLVRYAENLGWRDVDMRRLLAEQVAAPAGFGHDVRAGALAEWRLGAGRGTQDFAFLAVGTGISAALVLGGQLIVADGYAGEVGHGGRRGEVECVCGGRNCSETFASAAGMARAYRAASGHSVSGSAEVLARARAGDPVARAVWQDGVAELGAIIGDVVRVTGVPRIVLGGGLIAAGPDLLDPLARAVEAELTFHRMPSLVPAQLGPRAGVLGAALLGIAAAELSMPDSLTPTCPCLGAQREGGTP